LEATMDKELKSQQQGFAAQLKAQQTLRTKDRENAEKRYADAKKDFKARLKAETEKEKKTYKELGDAREKVSALNAQIGEFKDKVNEFQKTAEMMRKAQADVNGIENQVAASAGCTTDAFNWREAGLLCSTLLFAGLSVKLYSDAAKVRSFEASLLEEF